MSIGVLSCCECVTYFSQELLSIHLFLLVKEGVLEGCSPALPLSLSIMKERIDSLRTESRHQAKELREYFPFLIGRYSVSDSQKLAG